MSRLLISHQWLQEPPTAPINDSSPARAILDSNLIKTRSFFFHSLRIVQDLKRKKKQIEPTEHTR